MANESANDTAIRVQHWLDRLQTGDEVARRELLSISLQQLRRLSRKILAANPTIRRLEETDDVLQNASIRLWRALERQRPAQPLDYFRLAALIIRRELLDLVRRNRRERHGGGRVWVAGNGGSQSNFTPVDGAIDESQNPQALAEWTEFHEYIEQLPEHERELFDLLWYQGLTQQEASKLLNLPERTIRRHWKTARINLYQSLLDGRDSTESNSPQ